MAYNSNFRSSEITGANPVTITNEAQVVVDLSYKSAGSRGVLLSEAPLKESPSTIVMTVGGTTFTEVDISAFTGAANTFAVEYASNSGVILLPPGTALGTATTTTYKGLGSVATIESKRYNPDGLVGSPSISFEDDPDTGLYRNGANNMGFAAGGVQTSQLNSLGVLNGLLGTDFRNVVQVVNWRTENTTPYLMRNTLQYANIVSLLINQGRITARTTGGIILVTGNMCLYASNSNSTSCSTRITYQTTGSLGTPGTTNVIDGTIADTYGRLDSVASANHPAASMSINTILNNAGTIVSTVAGTTYTVGSWAYTILGSSTHVNVGNTSSMIYLWELY